MTTTTTTRLLTADEGLAAMDAIMATPDDKCVVCDDKGAVARHDVDGSLFCEACYPHCLQLWKDMGKEDRCNDDPGYINGAYG